MVRSRSSDSAKIDEILQILGVDSSDLAIYEHYLRHPSWSAAEIAVATGLTDQQVTESRRRLVEAGLLAVHPDKLGQFLPVGPREAVERRIADFEAVAARRRADMMRAGDRLASFMASQVADHRHPPETEIEHVTDHAATQLLLPELLRTAQREVHVLNADAPPYPDTVSLLDLGVPRRISLYAIYQHEHVLDPAVLPYLERLVGEGAQIRTASRLGLWSVVIDRSIGITPAGDDSEGGIVVVRGTGMVKALSILFDRCWTLAQPFAGDHPEDGAGGGGLSHRDRTLLRLLSLGIKDEAVARHLNVSVRTVRRQVSVLFDRLGVSSRFQAGVQAARQHWI